MANGWEDDGWGDVVEIADDASLNDMTGDAPIWDYGAIGSQVVNTFGGGGYGYTPTAGAIGPAIGALGRAVSPMVFNAIIKLSSRLGGATGSVLGYGKRAWSQLSSWAAKNPGVSLMSMLVSLGLTVEEAAHFISWGATTKKKRRTRGITGRDLKTTRRTLRKFSSMQHLISQACHRAVPGRRRRK